MPKTPRLSVTELQRRLAVEEDQIKRLVADQRRAEVRRNTFRELIQEIQGVKDAEDLRKSMEVAHRKMNAAPKARTEVKAIKELARACRSCGALTTTEPCSSCGGWTGRAEHKSYRTA